MADRLWVRVAGSFWLGEQRVCVEAKSVTMGKGLKWAPIPSGSETFSDLFALHRRERGIRKVGGEGWEDQLKLKLRLKARTPSQASLLRSACGISLHRPLFLLETAPWLLGNCLGSFPLLTPHNSFWTSFADSRFDEKVAPWFCPWPSCPQCSLWGGLLSGLQLPCLYFP